MQLLEKIDQAGDLPTLQSRQLDEDSSFNRLPTSDVTPIGINPTGEPSPIRSWTSNLNFFLPRIMRRSPQVASQSISPEDRGTGLFRQRKNKRSVPPSSTPCPDISSPEVSEIIPRFPTFVTPQPPVVRVRSITLCLFPAEDLHRVSLR